VSAENIFLVPIFHKATNSRSSPNKTY